MPEDDKKPIDSLVWVGLFLACVVIVIIVYTLFSLSARQKASTPEPTRSAPVTTKPAPATPDANQPRIETQPDNSLSGLAEEEEK